jgi:hypothetical protein
MRQQSYYFVFRPATHQLIRQTTFVYPKQDLGVTDKAPTETAPSFNTKSVPQQHKNGSRNEYIIVRYSADFSPIVENQKY